MHKSGAVSLSAAVEAGGGGPDVHSGRGSAVGM